MPLFHVPVAPVSPDRLLDLLEGEQRRLFARKLDRGRDLLAGRVVWNVNSTARGGGVAEMLASLLAYVRGGGVDARWVVLRGDHDFFAVTKRLHNMLHASPGDGRGLTEADERIYRARMETAAAGFAPLVRAGDVVILHDPQTAGLVEPLRARGAHVIWRCHIGIDRPDGNTRTAWRFLIPHVRAAEATVFSRRAYIWPDIDPARVAVIQPSIDAFTAKNQDLDPRRVKSILAAARIGAGNHDGRPDFDRLDGTPGRVDRRALAVASSPLPATARAVVQVSRWDRLKDHLGVLRAFAEHIAPQTDAHLVLAGPAAAAVADDPEAEQTLAEVARFAATLAPELRERVHLFVLPMDDPEENAAIVNALQRRADVVVQKSLAEGFGLTVAEAMWKARPVVASRCGGILEQISDGESGLLVGAEDLAGFGEAVRGLLADPARATAIGERAREVVRERFLGHRHLIEYVELLDHLLGGPRRRS